MSESKRIRELVKMAPRYRMTRISHWILFAVGLLLEILAFPLTISGIVSADILLTTGSFLLMAANLSETETGIIWQVSGFTSASGMRKSLFRRRLLLTALWKLGSYAFCALVCLLLAVLVPSASGAIGAAFMKATLWLFILDVFFAVYYYSYVDGIVCMGIGFFLIGFSSGLLTGLLEYVDPAGNGFLPMLVRFLSGQVYGHLLIGFGILVLGFLVYALINLEFYKKPLDRKCLPRMQNRASRPRR